MKQVTQEWIDKAEGDYRATALLIAGDQPLLEASVFHAQQCAEKYLKALLQEHGIRFPRTHNLTVLARLSGPLVPSLAALDANLAELNVYAVETRYPGAEMAREDAESAIQTGAEVRGWYEPPSGSRKRCIDSSLQIAPSFAGLCVRSDDINHRTMMVQNGTTS